MLRRSLFALPLLVATVAAQAVPAVGQAAPDFTLTDAAGKTVKLSDYRGKHVVLEWTNPGCPYVRKHYDSGNMPATQKDATAKGVVWLAINSTARDHYDWLEPGALATWMSKHKAVPNAILVDAEGTVGKAYGARTTPHIYIVDPQGKLAYAGGIDSVASSHPSDIGRAVNYVRQAVGEVTSGKPISMAVTRPYGCSVKYKSAA